MLKTSSQSERRYRSQTAHLADPPLPKIFTRCEARAAGMTDRQIDRRVASGIWTSIRRGVFTHSQPGIVLSQEPAANVANAAELARTKAFLISHADRDLALSHVSAALMHDLARPIGGWDRPTATTASGPTRLRGDVHVLVAPLPDGDVVMMGDVPVTSLARTVADCLRAMRPHDALAVADSAARQGLLLSDLEAVMQRQGGWPGITRARELAELIDARRETALESWSAWTFHRWEIPPPQWQIEIYDDRGYFCGRVDSWWLEGVAGEADGRAKYALSAAERLGVNADGLADVLDLERKREESVRRTGAEMVRWGTKDLFTTVKAESLTRYIQQLLRVRPRQGVPFRGTARQPPLTLPVPTA